MNLSAIIVAFIVFGGAYFRWWKDKQHDRETFNKAILAEVQRLLDVLQGHTSWWESCISKGTTDHILLPFSTDIYDEHVKDIGMVDTEFVAIVVKLYGYIKYINRYQEMEKFYQQTQRKPYFDKSYLKLLKKTLGQFDKRFDLAFSRYGFYD